MKVRRARKNDLRHIADIHVRSWQTAYRDILPDPVLDRLSVFERKQAWKRVLGDEGDHRLTLVTENSGGVLTGFCSAEIPSSDKDAGETTPEIAVLYVDPDHWRRGAGSALLSAMLDELHEAGWRDVVLWVLPENRPALAFYEHFGFTVENDVTKREERSERMVIRLRSRLDEGRGRPQAQ